MRPLLRVVALASEHSPDAALLALQAEIDAADMAWEACYQQLDAAEDACLAAAPSLPKEPAAGDPRKIWAAIEASDPVPLLALKGAWDKYRSANRVRREALEQAERVSGLAAAKEALNAADCVRLAIRDEKIIPMRARTLNGLIFKVRYAAAHFPGEFDEGVMRSIVDDLIALAGEAFHVDA